MKSLICVVSAALFSCSSALAQSSMPAPTRFELYSQKPGARIALEREVGSIKSPDITLRVNAMAVDDSAAQRMTGVRIDFAGPGVDEQIYLDEEQARTLRRELRMMEMGLPEQRASRDAPHRVQGTESCWMPNPPTRILCPDYYIGPDKATFRAGAFRGTLFEFPEYTPVDLATLIDQAIATITMAPASAF